MKRTFIFTLCGVYLLSGCATTTQKDLHAARKNVNSTLWIQTSSEYVANVTSLFSNAKRALDDQLSSSHTVSALYMINNPSTLEMKAIVVDIDETVLDNSPYQAQLIKDESEWSEKSWDSWVRLAQAEAVPGAVDYINYALSRGLKVIYITNRKCIERDNSECPQKAETVHNLIRAGINEVDEDLVYLVDKRHGWTSEKESRRKLIADQYFVIQLVGDDLGDFFPDVKENTTPVKRRKLVECNHERWGTQWFMLPNPTYGSWLTILKEPKDEYLKPISHRQ